MSDTAATVRILNGNAAPLVLQVLDSGRWQGEREWHPHSDAVAPGERSGAAVRQPGAGLRCVNTAATFWPGLPCGRGGDAEVRRPPCPNVAVHAL
jgi:hypothetical protein